MNSSGFGFIAPDRGGGEVWVRPHSLNRDPTNRLREGDAVAFELRFGPYGGDAVSIRQLPQ